MYGYLGEDAELPAIVTALDARYIRPSQAATSSAIPKIFPPAATFTASTPSIPSIFAMKEGEKQAARLLIGTSKKATRCPNPWPSCYGEPTTSRPRASLSRRRWH